MSDEIAKHRNDEMNEALSQLQKEKNHQDKALASLVQEKLHLQQELERLKSYINSQANDTPFSLPGVDEYGNSIKSKLSMENIRRIKKDIMRAGSSGNLESSRSVEINDFKSKEPMLTDNIEIISDILDSADPLTRVSGSYATVSKDLLTDCFTIIDEQDKLLQTLQKSLSEKVDEVERLKSELSVFKNT